METSLKSAQRDIEAGQHCIVCLDENSAHLGGLIAGDNCRYVTNRFDIAQKFNSDKTPVVFSDWVIDVAPSSQDIFVFRLSKEKAINEHLLKLSQSLLKPDGRLIFSGQKNDGFKTYAKKTSGLFGSSKSQKNGNEYIFEGHSPAPADEEQVNDLSYSVQQDIGNDFVSKPGQFGWNKFDLGSQLLVDTLVEDMAGSRSNYESVLDLGCGYGFIAKNLAEKIDSLRSFTLTDNNAAALLSAKINLAAHANQARSVRVIAADCAQNINETFDMIVCNPPFHQGFDVENQLTDKFLESARNHLNRHGTAYFVVNSFIGIEKKSKAYFPSCETLANNKRFKVLKFRKVAT